MSPGCHLYVTLMYSDVVIHMSFVCGFTMNQILFNLILLKETMNTFIPFTRFVWFVAKLHTSDVQMTYEYIRVTYGWRMSIYEWHTDDKQVHTSDIPMTNKNIRVTYGWNTSACEWHTDDIQGHTSDIRMTYKYIRVTYGCHTSIYEWHKNDIRVHTSDIRMIYEYIWVTYRWHTSTYEWHTNDIWVTYQWHAVRKKNKIIFFKGFWYFSFKIPDL